MSALRETFTACSECHRRVRHDKDRGWYHSKGGGPVWFGCEGCYHAEAWWPIPATCPLCNGRLIDLHTAAPATAKRSTA